LELPAWRWTVSNVALPPQHIARGMEIAKKFGLEIPPPPGV